MIKNYIKKAKSEKGEIMLESILVMIPTLFVMVFLLSLGFLLYQKWNVQFVADDVASKVAVSYEYIDSNMPNAKVTEQQAQKTSLYKYLFSIDKYNEKNAEKGRNYGMKILKLTGYGVGVGNENIEVTVEEDSLARRHVCVEVTGTYKIPFSEGLEIFGIDGTRTFSATSYAECVDVSDHINTVVFGERVGEILFGESKILETINTWIGVFKNLFEW